MSPRRGRTNCRLKRSMANVYCFQSAVSENRTTLDANRRITALKNAQKEFYTQVPSLFVERRYNWLVSAPNFEDVQWVNDGLPLFDRIWLKRK